MTNSYLSLLKKLSILLMLLHSIAYADSQEQTTGESPLYVQLAQLQTQVQENNSKIAALEAALNTANQDINVLQNEVTVKLNKIAEESTKTKTYRTANGHGR